MDVELSNVKTLLSGLDGAIGSVCDLDRHSSPGPADSVPYKDTQIALADGRGVLVVNAERDSDNVRTPSYGRM